MTIDEIVKSLRTAVLPPAEALRAAVDHADALAPLVYERAAAACRGVCMFPDEVRFLFHGLHVLAAARHAGLYPHLVELARLPEDELQGLFIHRAARTLGQMMLSVWDGDADALMHLIEHADMGEAAKWALFEVLARLTFDGRIPRDATSAFIARFERDGLADDDDQAWWGWENTVVKLGMLEHRAALERVMEKAVNSRHEDNYMAECLADLENNAAKPADPSPFDAEEIRPIDDPVAALSWIERALKAMEEHDRDEAAMDAEGADPDDDPAAPIRLSPEKLSWLSRFLLSRQVPFETMSMLMLDGFLTAVALSPVRIHVDTFWPRIWSEDGVDGVEPAWEPGQKEFVAELIDFHRMSIAMRRQVRSPHFPLIDGDDEREFLAEWAEGMMIGIDAAGDPWRALMEHPRGIDDVLALEALCEGESTSLGRPATDEECAAIAARLPQILQRIALFWDDPAAAYPKQMPVRVQRIGRNDACPCGSGKKYKKCCGQSTPAFN